MTDKRLINIGDGRIVEMTEMGEVPAEPSRPQHVKNPGARAGKRKKSPHTAIFKHDPKMKNAGRIKGSRDHIPGYREWELRRRQQIMAFYVERSSRRGVPDGMRRDEADARWAEAKELAKKDMANLKNAGVISPDDERAEEAMLATLEIMRSPMNVRERLAAARQVLEWTKAKPASKTEMTVNAAEAWLASLAESDGDSD